MEESEHIVYVENTLSSDLSWRRNAFRVKDYVNLSSSVQLKFIASDSIRPGQYLDGGSLIEAAVDDLYLYEMIQIADNAKTRARTWQWFKNHILFQRTLIDENRVSVDWKKYDRTDVTYKELAN